MQAPKILPRIASKAGISEELALKLWRRAVSESECLSGKADGPEYWGLALDRFLAIVEEEAGSPAHYGLMSGPKVAWLWRQQSRMSLLSISAAQQAWQGAWGNPGGNQKAA